MLGPVHSHASASLCRRRIDSANARAILYLKIYGKTFKDDFWDYCFFFFLWLKEVSSRKKYRKLKATFQLQNRSPYSGISMENLSPFQKRLSLLSGEVPSSFDVTKISKLVQSLDVKLKCCYNVHTQARCSSYLLLMGVDGRFRVHVCKISVHPDVH